MCCTPSSPSKCTRRTGIGGGVSGYGCHGAQQFKKCICAQCQQISTLMQIEFTINPPEATSKNNTKKEKERRARKGKKAKKMKMEILALWAYICIYIINLTGVHCFRWMTVWGETGELLKVERQKKIKVKVILISGKGIMAKIDLTDPSKVEVYMHTVLYVLYVCRHLQKEGWVPIS